MTRKKRFLARTMQYMQPSPEIFPVTGTQTSGQKLNRIDKLVVQSHKHGQNRHQQ